MSQLFELFAKRSATKILEFFLDNPSGEFYGSEVRKKLGVAKASSVKWLKKLVDYDFLLGEAKGRTIFYRLNSDNIVIKELKKLKLVSLLIPKVKKLGGVEVFLYGSCARGEDREESDVDLLVIGGERKEIIETISDLEKKINRRLKVSFYSQLEWSKMARKDPAFYERVEKDKIRLI
jgi:predicted nucleotidyltransferase